METDTYIEPTLSKEEFLMRYIALHPNSTIAFEYSRKQQKLAEVQNRVNLIVDLFSGSRIAQTPEEISLDATVKMWKFVIECRIDKELTLRETGLLFNPPKSGEHVRHIQKEISAALGIEFPSGKPRAVTVTTKCRWCGTDVVKKAAQYKGEGIHSCKLCSHPSKDEQRRRQREQIKFRYHNDPEFRKKRITQSLAWHYREMAYDSPHHRHVTKYMREYFRRTRTKEGNHESWLRRKEQLAEKRKDPEFVKQEREKWNAIGARRRLRAKQQMV